jgi:PAS domain S-box-containing protein
MKEEEIKRYQEEINELIDYINGLFNFLPIPICDLSSTFYTIQVNKAFEKLTGFDSLEITGENIEKLFPEKEKIKKIISLLQKERELQNQELILTKKKGEEIIVNTFWAARIKKEEVEGFLLAFIDITLLKRIQKEMEEEIKLKTKDLREKIIELEKFQKIAIGRELKMIELKEEIKKLREELEKLKSKQRKE